MQRATRLAPALLPALLALPAQAQTITSALPVVADTTIDQSKPNENFGRTNALDVSAGPSRRALLRVDPAALNTLGPAADLVSAHLELTLTAPPQVGRRGEKLTVHRMTRAWSETGATWNCPDDRNTTNRRPDGPRWHMSGADRDGCDRDDHGHGRGRGHDRDDDDHDRGRGRDRDDRDDDCRCERHRGHDHRGHELPYLSRATDQRVIQQGQVGLVRFDVTSDVRAVLQGTSHRGWLVRSSENDRVLVRFGSREANATVRPRLVIVRRGDQTPPTVVGSAPAFVGATQLVTFDLADPESGLAAGSFRAAIGARDATAAFQVVGGRATATGASLGAITSDGLTTVTATVSNGAGLTGSGTVSFHLDLTAPTATWSPAPNTVLPPGSVDLTLTVSDPAGLDWSNVRFEVDQVDRTADFLIQGNVARATLQLAPGLHAVVAFDVRDSVGNDVDTGTLYRADASPPVVRVVRPEPDQPVTTADVLIVAWTDEGTGVDRATGLLVEVDGRDVTALALPDTFVPPRDPNAAAPAESSATEARFLLSALGLAEGAHTVAARVTDRVGLVGQTTTSLLLDMSPPSLAISPGQGTTSPDDVLDVVVTWTDVSPVASPSLLVLLDGSPVTERFVVSATGATWTTDPLPAGSHSLQVLLRDVLGNQGYAAAQWAINPTVARFELDVGPGAAAVLAGAEHDVVVRALSPTGRPVASFAGAVAFDTTDPHSPLNGHLAQFEPGRDRGVLRVPGLGTFFTPGTVFVRVTSLDQDGLSADDQVEVLLGQPTIDPSTPTVTTTAQLTVRGNAYPGRPVELLVDGVLATTVTAGPDGRYAAPLVLAEGPHALVARATDPDGVARSSHPWLVLLDQTTAAAPVITSPRPGAVVTNRLSVQGQAEPGATVQVFDQLGGSVLVGQGACAPDGTFAVAAVLTTGEHRLVARQTDAVGHVSPFSSPVQVTSGHSPVWGRVYSGASSYPQPLPDVPVRLLPAGPTVLTDGSGRFVLDGPAGLAVVSIDGRTFGHVRLDLPLVAREDAVVDPAPIFLEPLPRDLQEDVPVVDGVVQATVVASSPRVPLAAIEVAAGTRVDGAPSPLRVAIRPVDVVRTPVPLPLGLNPTTLWELAPSGVHWTPGVTLRVPNRTGLLPGQSVPVFGLKAVQGGWLQVGLATVDPTGAQLVTASTIDGFSLFALDDASQTVDTTVRVRVVTRSGTPLAARVHVAGVAATQVGPGTYEVALQGVAALSPLRAVVEADLPDGAGGTSTLAAESRPAFARAPLTDLGTVTVGLALEGAHVPTAATTPATRTTAGDELVVSVHSPAAAEPAGPGLKAAIGFLHASFAEPNSPPSATIADVASSASQGRYLTFALEVSNPEGGLFDVRDVEVTRDGGATWEAVTVSGGDPLSLLPSPPGGRQHLYAWDSHDLGLALAPEAQLRVRIRDAGGRLWTTAPSATLELSTFVAQVSPAAADLGTLRRDQASPTRQVTLTNASTRPLPFDLLTAQLEGSGAAAFVLDPPLLPRTLQWGDGVAFGLSAAPGLAQGAYSAELVVTTNVPGATVRVPVTVRIVEPRLVVTPTTVAFGTVRVGDPAATGQLEIRNDASAASPLQVSGLVFSGSASITLDAPPATPFTLQPGEFRTLTARFAPTAPSAVTATLQVQTDDPDGSVVVQLSGTGQRPLLRVTPTTVAFDQVLVGSSAERMVLVENVAAANTPLRVTNFTLQDAAGGVFAVASAPSTPLDLQPGEAAAVVLRFSPAAEGQRTGRLVVETNDPDTPSINVQLVGTGITANGLLTPASPFDFGLRRAGAQVVQTFAVMNPGVTPTLTITSVAVVEGTAFVVTSDQATGAALGHGQTATFGVRYTATSSSDQGRVRLETSVGPIDLVLSGQAGLPRLVLEPALVDLGDVDVGVVGSATLLISNAPDATLDLTIDRLVPPSDGIFTITSSILPGTRLRPGEAVGVRVNFTPTTADEDPRQATLVVVSDDPTTPSRSVTLQGRGTRPVIKVTPALIDVGVVRDGVPRPTTVTIENLGNATLDVESVQIVVEQGPADAFIVSGDVPDGVAAGAAEAFDVVYLAQPGRVRARLEIRTNDPTRPLVTVILLAQGELASFASLQPEFFDFAVSRVGTTATRTVQVTNAANATADLVVVLRSLTAPGGFSTPGGEDVRVVVPPGESRPIELQFKGPAEGSFEAEVVLETSDPRFPTLSVPVGAFAGRPRLEADLAVDLGDVRVGETIEVPLFLANSGAATWDLRITERKSLNFSNGQVTFLGAKEITLGPGSEDTAKILVRPNGSTPLINERIVFLSDDPDRGPSYDTFVISGRVVRPTSIEITPSSFSLMDGEREGFIVEAVYNNGTREEITNHASLTYEWLGHTAADLERDSEGKWYVRGNAGREGSNTFTAKWRAGTPDQLSDTASVSVAFGSLVLETLEPGKSRAPVGSKVPLRLTQRLGDKERDLTYSGDILWDYSGSVYARAGFAYLRDSGPGQCAAIYRALDRRSNSLSFTGWNGVRHVSVDLNDPTNADNRPKEPYVPWSFSLKGTGYLRHGNNPKPIEESTTYQVFGTLYVDCAGGSKEKPIVYGSFNLSGAFNLSDSPGPVWAPPQKTADDFKPNPPPAETWIKGGGLVAGVIWFDSLNKDIERRFSIGAGADQLRLQVTGSATSNAILKAGFYGVVIADGVDELPMANLNEDPAPPEPDGPQETPAEEGDSDGTSKTNCQVLLASGEERFERVDLAIPGRGGAQFVFRRTYRSRVSYDGWIGHGWDHNFNEAVQGGGRVQKRYNGHGRVDVWRQDFPGYPWVGPPGVFGALENGSYREPDGTIHTYGRNGRLEELRDRHGNLLRFQYGSRGELKTIIDPFSRRVSLEYAWKAGRLRLRKIKDWTNREVVYTYDDRGDLVEVRTPVSEDSPTGRVERYTYSHGFADRRLNHNILSVTYPEEVENGGEPGLTWEYGTDPADPLTFDKVKKETEGGTNATGVASGGTREIRYERLDASALAAAGIPVDPNPEQVPVTRVTVKGRCGCPQEHYLNARGFEIRHRILRRPEDVVAQGGPAFYETRKEFDVDGQVTRQLDPELSETRYTYDRSGPRRQQANVIEMRQIAGPRGSGHKDPNTGAVLPADDLIVRYAYEPLYQQISKVVDPRGNAGRDGKFVPPVGQFDVERYTTRFFYDYQEGASSIPEAETWQIWLDPKVIARGLLDLNGDGDTRAVSGNVVRIQGPRVDLRPGSKEAARTGQSTQQAITELRWNIRGQLTTSINSVGTRTDLAYYPENDPDGDGVAEIGSEANTTPTGYLKSVVVDSAAPSPRRQATHPPLQLTSLFKYDRVGNVVESRNPRGVWTKVQRNTLNEPVLVTRGSNVADAVFMGQVLPTEAAFEYTSRLTYDKNGRLIRSEVEDRGSTPGVGTHLETEVIYDLLGNVLERRVEVDAGAKLVTRMRYDEDERLVLVVRPEGDETTTTWDPRDLRLSVTRGANSPEASTTRFSYDSNGNLVAVTDAEDSDGDGALESTRTRYDGFDRVVEVLDPTLTRTVQAYDPSGHVVSVLTFGSVTGVAGSPQALLSEVRRGWDELGRPFREERPVFVPYGTVTVRPVDLSGDADRIATTYVEYDVGGRATFAVEDDGESVATSFDAVGRPVLTVDAGGNRRELLFDLGSNVIRARSVEIPSSGLALAPETFTTHYVYDQLGRLLRATDNAGQTSRFTWDALDRLAERSDPNGVPAADPLGLFAGPINGPGNTCSWVYDGLGRALEEHLDLRVGGTGAGALDGSNPTNPDGRISVRYGFDKNSRLVSVTDDALNTTTSRYDNLDRRVEERFADGTFRSWTWDKDDDLRQYRDARGTVVTWTRDADGRETSCSVQRGSGVGGTTFQAWRWDGLDRLVAGSDDNGDVARTHTVERAYDSLGQLLEERQDGRVLSMTWSGDGSRLAVQYPGGRRLTAEYDALDRVVRLRDAARTGGPLLENAYMGPGERLVRRLHDNGTQVSFLDPTGTTLRGYDAVQRAVRVATFGPGGATIVDREYGYDRAGTRTFERRLDEGGLTDRWTYDSAYRIVRTEYDRDGVGTRRDLTQVDYRLDGVGNRREVQRQATTTGATTEAYTVNSVNEYVQIGAFTRSHDQNGNVTSDGQGRGFVYDWKDRLVAVIDTGTQNLVARYTYDHGNRRVTKTVYAPTPQFQRVCWDGWQEVEEQDASGATTTTFVHGSALDEHVSYERTSSHPLGVGAFTTHQSIRGDVVAITNDQGQVVEKIKCDDFGQPERASSIGNPHLFQGARFDAETGLYYLRNRYYDPRTGRFLQRDPVWDPGNAGNQYSFADHGPVSGNDPLGLCEGAEDQEQTLEDELAAYIKQLEGVGPEVVQKALETLDMGLNILPGVGLVKGLFEAATGQGLGIQRKVPLWERILSVLPYVGTALRATAKVAGLAFKTVGKVAAMGAKVVRAGRTVGRELRHAARAGGALSRVARSAAPKALRHAPNLPCGAVQRQGSGLMTRFRNWVDPGCFLKGTLVVIVNSDGSRATKQIEEIREGDRVLSADPKTGKVGPREVVRLFPGVTDQVCKVVVAARRPLGRTEAHRVRVGSGEGEEDGEPPPAEQEILCTPNHPFWREESQDYVPANTLRPGDLLQSEDGEPLEVQSVELRQEWARTWNFEVVEFHTYFVSAGASGALVHNTNCAAGTGERLALKPRSGVGPTDPIRQTPGVASGSANLSKVTGQWLENGAGAFPGQIAQQLEGKHFSSFARFREAFWKLVAADPHLSAQFNKTNRDFMAKGMAPVAPGPLQLGAGAANRSFNLDHLEPLADNLSLVQARGLTYAMDNMQILAPVWNQLRK